MRILLAILALAAGASAADYKISSVSRDPKGTKVTVRFAAGSEPPKAAAEAKENWSVLLFPGSRPATVEAAAAVEYEHYGEVNLTVNIGAPAEPKQYLVVFHNGDQVADKLQAYNRKPLPTGPTAATSRDDSNVYVFGGINAAAGVKPTFNIDSFIDWRPSLNGFTVNAAVKTDNRKKVDPDSFTVKLGYVRLLGATGHSTSTGPHFDGVAIKLLPAGTEFDRKRRNLNFVASPLVIFPFHAYSTDAQTGNVLRVWNLSLRFGAEVGNNFRNSLDENGFGGFARLLGGATNNLIFRKALSFDRISLTSDYEARLPNQAELFSDSTIKVNGEDTPVFRTSRQTRHHLTNDLNFMINEYWGFAVKHEYGSLPPVFNLVDHKVSIGLTFKLKEQ
jgi:hypothetical protein